VRQRPKITEYKFDQWADNLRDWIQESVSPFESDTPEKQKARIERGRHDRLYFFKTYFPHYFSVSFEDFHEEWSDLADIQDEPVLIAAPREHAKSTEFTFGVPLHDIVYERKWFVIIVSDTNDQATGFTLPIRLELEENPRLRHDFGNLRGRTWTKSDFTTSTGIQVLARGRGEKVRGLKSRQHRPDRVIVDDFENDENVENPKLVKKGIRWLRRAVIGSLGAGASFTMIGNLFHPKSVLSQLIAAKDEDGEPLYISRIYRAIIDYGKETARPLWPALWPMERLLKKKRSMGTIDFNAEMMNLCVAEDSPFPEEWFKYFFRSDLSIRDLIVATFIDPSAKSGEMNDFRAVITVGLHLPTMMFYVLHAWIRHASIGEMFDAAYRQQAEYGGIVGIEENMFGDFLHEAILNYAKAKQRYLPWKPVQHSTNKEGRIIGTLSYLVEYGRLLFEKGHSDQDLLIEQLIYLNNATVNDDGPDALEGAVNLLQSGSFGPVEYETVESRRNWEGWV
jgi:predicted phage terminase large subunit-like protein